MATHIPIGQAGFDIVFKKQIRPIHFNRLNNFQREFNEKLGVYMQRLPLKEYDMSSEHGKVDKYILYLYKVNDDYDYSYEIHLDKDWKVNQVYQVL